MDGPADSQGLLGLRDGGDHDGLLGGYGRDHDGLGGGAIIVVVDVDLVRFDVLGVSEFD